MSTYAVGFGDGGQVMVNTGTNTLIIYRRISSVKLDSVFDIIALRDLLNDAYPPKEVRYDQSMRMRSGS